MWGGDSSPISPSIPSLLESTRPLPAGEHLLSACKAEGAWGGFARRFPCPSLSQGQSGLRAPGESSNSDTRKEVSMPRTNSWVCVGFPPAAIRQQAKSDLWKIPMRIKQCSQLLLSPLLGFFLGGRFMRLHLKPRSSPVRLSFSSHPHSLAASENPTAV